MFQDRRIVITGGSSGLGLALAHALAREGAQLTLVARNPHKLEDAAAAIRARVPRARVAVETVDVVDAGRTTETFARIASAMGGIDMLVNSAGVLREGRFEELPPETFRELMEINYVGVLNTTRAALAQLKASRGCLVNIASMAGMTGVFGLTAYCASKHALVGLSEVLRYELRPQGVRVQLVCPTEFDSPLVAAFDPTRTPENRAHALTVPRVDIGTIVAGTLAGLRSQRFLIVPGRRSRLAAWGIRHFPALARAMGDRSIARARRASNLVQEQP